MKTSTEASIDGKPHGITDARNDNRPGSYTMPVSRPWRKFFN